MWMIVRAHSKMVKKVADEIGGYVPTYKKWTKPARKHQPVLSEVPVFPGWVFVQYTEQLYLDLPSIRGVRGLLRNGKAQPILLDDSDMAIVLSTQVEEEPTYVPRSWAVGQEVKVLGLDGWIEAELAPGVYLVDVGGNYPLTVSEHQLTSMS